MLDRPLASIPLSSSLDSTMLTFQILEIFLNPVRQARRVGLLIYLIYHLDYHLLLLPRLPGDQYPPVLADPHVAARLLEYHVHHAPLLAYQSRDLRRGDPDYEALLELPEAPAQDGEDRRSPPIDLHYFGGYDVPYFEYPGHHAIRPKRLANGIGDAAQRIVRSVHVHRPFSQLHLRYVAYY